MPASIAPADAYVLPMLALAVGGVGSAICWIVAVSVWSAGQPDDPPG